MIHIDGLTSKQVEMLDKLWELNTTEDVINWLSSLCQEDFQIALVLQEMLIDSMLEQPAEEDTSMAKDMLIKIGVKV